MALDFRLQQQNLFNPLHAEKKPSAICWHYKELTILSTLAG